MRSSSSKQNRTIKYIREKGSEEKDGFYHNSLKIDSLQMKHVELKVSTDLQNKQLHLEVKEQGILKQAYW